MPEDLLAGLNSLMSPCTTLSGGFGKVYLTANVQHGWSRRWRDGMVDLLAVPKLNNAFTREKQVPDLEFEFGGQPREGVEFGQRLRVNDRCIRLLNLLRSVGFNN